MDLLKSRLYRDDLDAIASEVDLSDFTNRTILVTGGLGLICSALVDFLVECELARGVGLKIVVAARDEERFKEKYGAYPFVSFMPYEASEGFDPAGPLDYIIHGAGVASPDKYTAAPVETMLSNIYGIRSLLSYCAHHEVRRLLYISSSEVYGLKETEAPYRERDYGYVDIDSLRSSYPVAKRASELLCRSYASEYGVNVVIARPGHVFGPSAGRKDKRISSEFAFRAANGESLEIKSPGLQKRSYLYAPDCVKALLILLLKGEAGEAYNVGAEAVTTIREMASLYAEAGGVELLAVEPTKEEELAFNPMSNASLDISKIKALGYEDTFDAAAGFAHTVRILKELAAPGVLPQQPNPKPGPAR